jgi:AAA ATPase domain
MIQKLSIRNFKSVRELDMSCRRVNVFIGEPNTGKTNIVEAMGLRCGGCLLHAVEVFRASSFADLTTNQDASLQVGIGLDDRWVIIRTQDEEVLGIHELPGGGGHQAFRLTTDLNAEPETFSLTDQGKAPEASYYLFNNSVPGGAQSNGRLLSPFGENLLHLLYTSKEARQTASGFFGPTGFRLNVDFTDKRLRVSKLTDDVLISFPYTACSETLRRMVFHHLAIDTNKDAILVFDEPEAHAYPPYTKILAEKIALDDRGNQFFLTTHSPYMLDSLISKTPAEDLNVILCRMEDFETKAYVMTEEQKAQILDWSMDAFFNFDRLLPERE